MMKTQDIAVLACGAWLKNSAGLWQGGVWQGSALHGDLSEPGACLALEASARALIEQAKGRAGVQAIAHDLHPDFFSSRLAGQLAAELGVPAVAVQHHHAHIAAVLAEHGERGPVVGLALDGVGLGTDGQAWGGELLAVSTQGWRRLGHLRPLALPGGDVAAREPWRMASAALQALGRPEEIPARFGPGVGVDKARQLQQLLARGLNCPLSSSTGRWFDAAAGALGLSLRQSHEAEAAMALEAAASDWLAQARGHLPELLALRILPPSEAGGCSQLDLLPLLARLLYTIQVPALQGEAAACFHLSLADGLANWLAQAAESEGTQTVCLSGGCFMNRLLSQRLQEQLVQRGLRVLLPQKNSCGDAGLALGQAWVATHSLAMAEDSALASSTRCAPQGEESASTSCV